MAGCELRVHARGLCEHALSPVAAQGDPLVRRQLSWERLSDYAVTPAGCHIWRGYTDEHGKGVVVFEGRRWPVHRLAWRLATWTGPGGRDGASVVWCAGLFKLEHLQLAGAGPGASRRRFVADGAQGDEIRRQTPGRESQGQLAGRSPCHRCG